MVYLAEMPADVRETLVNQPLPDYVATPWAAGPALAASRIAIVTTAGLHRAGDPPFRGGSGDYRIIPSDTPPRELRMSHVSTNFDRIGFQHDHNVVFPLDRLHELASEAAIGSVARYHYSFMGATPPERLEESARELATVLRGDNVDSVILMGV